MHGASGGFRLTAHVGGPQLPHVARRSILLGLLRCIHGRHGALPFPRHASRRLSHWQSRAPASQATLVGYIGEDEKREACSGCARRLSSYCIDLPLVQRHLSHHAGPRDRLSFEPIRAPPIAIHQREHSLLIISRVTARGSLRWRAYVVHAVGTVLVVAGRTCCMLQRPQQLGRIA